ncbi:MAG: DUF5652 family protein [Bacteroidota bacterium]
MCTIQEMHSALLCFIPLLSALAIWESVWKIIAMWRSARNNHLVWFICIALINTVGILPIVYILTHRKKCCNDSKQTPPQV